MYGDLISPRGESSNRAAITPGDTIAASSSGTPRAGAAVGAATDSGSAKLETKGGEANASQRKPVASGVIDHRIIGSSPVSTRPDATAGAAHDRTPDRKRTPRAHQCL